MQTFTWLSALLFICYSLAAKFDYNRFRIMPEIVFKLFFWQPSEVAVLFNWNLSRVQAVTVAGPAGEGRLVTRTLTPVVGGEWDCLFDAQAAVPGSDRSPWFRSLAGVVSGRSDLVSNEISWRLLRFRDRFRSRADVDGPIRHWQRIVAAEPVHRDMCQSPWKASARSSNMFDEFSRARSSTKLVEVRTGREHACHCKN